MTMVHPTTRDFDQLLTTAATWLLVGCAGWALLICAAAVLEAVTRGRLRATTWVCCPRSLRRILLAGLGVTLVGVPGGATNTVPRSADGPSIARTARQQMLPVPARPLGAARRGASHVVVRPGDNLWHLAESRLSSSVPAAVVADLVASVHRSNREVIGPDPDLIRPGQRLALPRSPVRQTRPDQD